MRRSRSGIPAIFSWASLPSLPQAGQGLDPPVLNLLLHNPEVISRTINPGPPNHICNFPELGIVCPGISILGMMNEAECKAWSGSRFRISSKTVR